MKTNFEILEDVINFRQKIIRLFITIIICDDYADIECGVFIFTGRNCSTAFVKTRLSAIVDMCDRQ